jgi:hypothetical protein
LDKLSASWGAEGKLFIVTFIKEPTSTVFIASNILYDQNLKLFVVFEELSISENDAKLSFYTNSMVGRQELQDKYLQVQAVLKKRKGKWRIKELDIVSKPCCTGMFPDLYKSN